MSVLPKIYTLKNEAQAELYQWFDKEIRPLPKNSDGTINELTAEIMGRLNELAGFNSSPNSLDSENMDLWNNEVGRLKAKRVKTRRELYNSLIKALEDGELIIDLADPRKYKGSKFIKRIPKFFVIKIKENKTGANVEFLDIRKKIVLSKEDFIANIRAGKYPGYAVRRHISGEFPYSIRDKSKFNNLG